MKKYDTYLKEYTNKLTDENLKFLVGRLTQRLSGDVADAMIFLSETHELDRWMSTAKGSFELYDIIDIIAKAVEKECDRRER